MSAARMLNGLGMREPHHLSPLPLWERADAEGGRVRGDWRAVLEFRASRHCLRKYAHSSLRREKPPHPARHRLAALSHEGRGHIEQNKGRRHE